MSLRLATLMMWECYPDFASPSLPSLSGDDNRSTGQPADNGNQEKHQEDEEEYFGNPGCRTCNSTKTKNSGNDGDNEENYSPFKHCSLPHVN